jgi:transporter family-2 protein
MQGIGGFWLYPIILVAGALQAWGPPMNGALRNALANPWLASLVSFLPIVAFLGWLVGAFAVVVGLICVNQVGAGALAGLTITANILMSLIIDKYGWFGMEVHPLSVGRMAGAALMVGGIALISRF